VTLQSNLARQTAARLGPVGVWTSLLSDLSARAAGQFVREVERLGFAALWLPEGAVSKAILTGLVPVVATEWWQPASVGQIWAFQDMLNNQVDGRSTVWSSWFCYTDAMAPGFGLRGSNGAPNDAYYELVTAIA
jgi:hypothetical protein